MGPACHVIGSDSEAEYDGDALLHEGEPFNLGPGDGAWIPVRRRRRAGRAVSAATETEVVLQPRRRAADVAPGVRRAGAEDGPVFAANTGYFDQLASSDEVVGA
eukprot:4757934-Alexandrium_andersonii.AAC.1